MKAPKFITAMALAATLSATALPAYANNFNQTGGTGPSGEPMQESNVFDSSNDALEAQGDIKIDGKFTKIITTLPDPTDVGHYLRVTMPIKLDFTYDVDSHKMTSAESTITNHSVEVTSGQPTNNKINKSVNMSFVELIENTVGTGTLNKTSKFVTQFEPTVTDKVQLPFELAIEGVNGNKVYNYSLAQLESNATAIPSINIQPNASLKLKLQRINNQTIYNPELIKDHETSTSHALKLKFEYVK